MLVWAVAAAIAGALAVAAGAAFQERAVTAAPLNGVGQLQLLKAVARRPMWVLGTSMTVAGILAHMWALSHAPLVVIQPIGISGLLFAVMLSAFFRRRRLTTAQVTGSLAVTVALAGLLSTIPGSGGPRPDSGELTGIGLLAGCSMLVCTALGRAVSGAARACSLALASGVAYAAASAFGRVVGSTMFGAAGDPWALLQPLTAIALAIGLAGGLIMQNAYRAGHFALAYATLLISDPIAATVIGVAFFGEALPTEPIAAVVAVGAALLGAAGVITLARSSRSDGAVRQGSAAPAPSR
ncbi:DMT family transporter [Nocardiopsis coralliicola]